VSLLSLVESLNVFDHITSISKNLS